MHDPRRPAVDSLDARDKLVELGKEVQLLMYADEGDSFFKIENVIDAETKRVNFWQMYWNGENPKGFLRIPEIRIYSEPLFKSKFPYHKIFRDFVYQRRFHGAAEIPIQR
jgi:hypothetical protein